MVEIRNREGKDEYTAALFEKLESKDVQLDWKDIETILISSSKEVFGETSGKGAYNENNPGGGMMKYSVQ